LIGALVAGYLIYSTWFTKQDQGGIIRNFNNSITGEEERVSTTKTGGAPAGGDGSTPAEPEKSVW